MPSIATTLLIEMKAKNEELARVLPTITSKYVKEGRELLDNQTDLHNSTLDLYKIART